MTPTIRKARKHRPPRIRVPDQQKAIFTIDSQKVIGVVQRLSLTGGSDLLVKWPIPEETVGEMVFGTVFGKVNAHIEFLHTSADGLPLAQAFAFLAMDDRTVNASKRLSKKCILQTSRTLYRNKRRSTRHSKSWVKAFASFQECSTQCDKRDQKAEPVDLPPPEEFADAHQRHPA